MSIFEESFSVNKLCEELIETITKTRDKIVKKIRVEQEKAKVSVDAYINAMKVMQVILLIVKHLYFS